MGNAIHMEDKQMDADTERNVKCCDEWIKSFEARIKNAERTGEDVDVLKESLEGYKETRAGLAKDS